MHGGSVDTTELDHVEAILLSGYRLQQFKDQQLTKNRQTTLLFYLDSER